MRRWLAQKSLENTGGEDRKTDSAIKEHDVGFVFEARPPAAHPLFHRKEEFDGSGKLLRREVSIGNSFVIGLVIIVLAFAGKPLITIPWSEVVGVLLH